MLLNSLHPGCGKQNPSPKFQFHSFIGPDPCVDPPGIFSFPLKEILLSAQLGLNVVVKSATGSSFITIVCSYVFVQLHVILSDYTLR